MKEALVAEAPVVTEVPVVVAVIPVAALGIIAPAYQLKAVAAVPTMPALTKTARPALTKATVR
jgi:hypothetical protein